MSNDELKMICEIKGWNYSELARMLGMSRQTVARWASGRSKIPGVAKAYIEKYLLEDNAIANLENDAVTSHSRSGYAHK